MASKRYTPSLFDSGRIVITAGVSDLVLRGALNPLIFLQHHLTGNWGDISEQAANVNDAAINNSQRLLSSYTVNSDVTLLVVTAADRSTTTLLLPREYESDQTPFDQ